jgi:hypothetical protein
MDPSSLDDDETSEEAMNDSKVLLLRNESIMMTVDASASIWTSQSSGSFFVVVVVWYSALTSDVDVVDFLMVIAIVVMMMMMMVIVLVAADWISTTVCALELRVLTTTLEATWQAKTPTTAVASPVASARKICDYWLRSRQFALLFPFGSGDDKRMRHDARHRRHNITRVPPGGNKYSEKWKKFSAS